MSIELRVGESIFKDGPANLQKGWETVGGWIYLTNLRLVFKSHRLNVQAGQTDIETSAIRSVEKCWTRFLNLIPVAPNSLAVRTASGDEFRFVLFDRQGWKTEIEMRRQPAKRN